MAKMLCQITKREGSIARVPRGETPVIEIEIGPGAYVVSVALEEIEPYSASRLERKTADWRYTAYIANPLPG